MPERLWRQSTQHRSHSISSFNSRSAVVASRTHFTRAVTVSCDTSSEHANKLDKITQDLIDGFYKIRQRIVGREGDKIVEKVALATTWRVEAPTAIAMIFTKEDDDRKERYVRSY